MKNIKAVFFDWDGTLADSYHFLTDAHNYVRGQFGLEPFVNGEYKQHFGKPRDVIYPLIYGADNVMKAREHFEDFVVTNRHRLKPLAGANELMNALAATDLVLGVVSNKKTDYLRGEAESFGWGKFFDIYIGSEDAARDKPHPDPLLLAIEQAGMKGEPLDSILMVGDTANDLACAKAAGCPAVLVRNGVDVDHLIESFDPEYIFEDCAALQESLLQSR